VVGGSSATLHPYLDTLYIIMYRGAYFDCATVQPDGKTVEVGLIGREGFVGVPIIFGFKTSGLRVVTQADATGYRVDVPTLLRILPQCQELHKQLQRFSLILGMQSTQVAACNRLHGGRGTAGKMVVNEPGPDSKQDSSFDARVSVTDARHSQSERHHSCDQAAESGIDSLLARKRDHSKSAET
jgi:hypothetical protein